MQRKVFYTSFTSLRDQRCFDSMPRSEVAARNNKDSTECSRVTIRIDTLGDRESYDIHGGIGF